MKFSYIVRSIESGFEVFRTDRLSKAIEYIKKQEEPMMYEIVKIQTGEVVY